MRTAEKESVSVAPKGKIAAMLGTLDSQCPLLTYMGLAFWMAWNTIAFSGAFWFEDTLNSSRSERLITIHLALCIVTLIIFAVTSKKASNVIAKNWFTLLGAALASIGTLFIVVTAESLFPSAPLFYTGCVMTGVGTTFLFIRSAALFGCLPPHRVLYTLAICELCSFATYFVIDSCSAEVSKVLFVLLPVVSALCYCVRTKNVHGEKAVLRNEKAIPRKFAIFALSLMLCGVCFELVRAHILIELPPSYSMESTCIAQLVSMPVMLVIMVAAVLSKGSRHSFSGLYSISTASLVVLLVGISLFPSNSINVASAAWIIRACFNMTAWAMVFYLILQSKANAVKLLAIGNASMAAGSLIASLIATYVFELSIPTNVVDIALAGLGILTLACALTVFSRGQIESLLPEIDEQLMKDTAAAASQTPKSGKWDRACERITEDFKLSEREAEVLSALVSGYSAQEFADAKVLSIYTVRAHIRNIYAKLDVHSRAELNSFVEKNGGL